MLVYDWNDGEWEEPGLKPFFATRYLWMSCFFLPVFSLFFPCFFLRKLRQAKYDASDKGKARRAKYVASDKGKANQATRSARSNEKTRHP